MNNTDQVCFFINNQQCRLVDGKIISVYGIEVEDNVVNAFLILNNEPLSSVYEYAA